MPRQRSDAKGEALPDELDTDAEAAIAACGGNARAAIKALVILLDHKEAELRRVTAELAKLRQSVSRGYVRGKRGPPSR